MSSPIVLFDGVCNLCNASVNFIIRNDPKVYFRFSSLQSEFGQNINVAKGQTGKVFDSLILVDGHCVYFKSSAVLRIVKKLRGIWPVFFVFVLIPKPIRDFFYDLIAKYRYRIFGLKETRMVPPKSLKNRFL